MMELPEESVDLIITDPPFSSGARTDAGKTMRGSMLRGQKWGDDWFSHDNMATLGLSRLIHLVGAGCLRLARRGASFHAFIDWRMYPTLYESVESSGWRTKNLLVWDKEHFGMGTNYRNQHELILYAEKENRDNFANHGIGNVIRCRRPDQENHPTEKPIALLKQLMETAGGEDVIDPFCGSGSTLIAAKQLGRRAIGIEISEKYCEIAVNRLRQMELYT
jgi:site-specific DNA-methyltransferase (adenine-specific)